MRSLLLLADTAQQVAQLRRLLGEEHTLLASETQVEALDFLRLTKVDVIVAMYDTHGEKLESFFDQAKALQPHCVTLCLPPPMPSQIEDQPFPRSDFFLRRPFQREELSRMLAQAIEKQQMQEELASLRNLGAVAPPTHVSPQESEVSLARVGPILRNFAKPFSANFDLERALHHFLEAVSEFLRPSRLSVLVLNPVTREFTIQAHRGMHPQVAKSIRLHADEGLPLWLLTEARLIHRTEAEERLRLPAYAELYREMQALRAVASMPLLASGSLVGILNLGERITGVPYTVDELEILFSLCSHIALTLRDIHLYHEVQSQKIFTENILTNMSRGVISIGADEKIRIFNNSATEILMKAQHEVLNEDLRSLPSPLGDLLYETLRDGVTYRKHEVVLAAGHLPLEVSTNRIFDDQQQLAGSVMIFEDLTPRKQLYEEQRRADQLDFLNKVVGRMAHEIKNPLVSIQTFAELLGENFDDPEFRQYFGQVVHQDIHTINAITEKLVSFASQISYRFEHGDVNTVLSSCVAALPVQQGSAMQPATQQRLPNDSDLPGIELSCSEGLPPVKFDPEQLRKALLYIVIYLQQSLGPEGKLRLTSQARRGEEPGEWVYLTLTGSDCHLAPDELEHLFDPFDMEHSTLVDVGPCVSQKIVEEHGGRLDVRQEPNGGITFVIVLPVAQ